MQLTTDNYRKHTSKNPIQHYLIENFMNTVVEEVRKLSPKSILDVGCGEGFTLEKLYKAKIGEQLEGIDFLKTAIVIGRNERPYLRLKEGSIYDIPHGDNSFDMLLCTEVMEHLEDPQKALAELHRVTRKYVLLSVPNEPIFMLSNLLRGKNLSRFGNDIEHIQHWTIPGFRKFVSQKFVIRKMRLPFPWTMLIGEKK